jgi:hypothetical protein
VLAENSNPNDPYAIRRGEKVYTEGLRFADYGSPVITDDADLSRIAQIMRRLAVENKLVGKALQENLQNMAKASIKAVGLVIPSAKMNAAVEQAVRRFAEEWEKPWVKDKKKGKDGDSKKDGKPWEDEDDDNEDEGVAEDQYKIPLRKPRGMSRSNFSREMGKGAKSESRVNVRQAIAEGISWGKAQDDAIPGQLGGVNFIFDHGGDDDSLKPVVLSEDGAVEIPIPSDLYDDAFAAANMIEGDGTNFVQWLAESIEQLRPLSSSEERMLDEAVAKITTGPDGTISVEVSDDVEVNNTGDGMGDEIGDEMGGVGEMGDEMEPMDDEGMSPVDATDPEAAGEMGGEEEVDPGAEDSMPDFENGGESMDAGGMNGDEMAHDEQQPPKPGEEDDGIHFEDRDITAPPNAKFTAHVKDNKRKTPEVKVPGKTNDRLEAIGPDLKVDDGTGTKPPVSRKNSDD